MKVSRRRPPGAVTTASRANLREPLLPHERDESSDGTQTPVNPDVRKVGRQAARDLDRGLVDTDRGPVFERLSAEHFKKPAGRRVPGRR